MIALIYLGFIFIKLEHVGIVLGYGHMYLLGLSSYWLILLGLPSLFIVVSVSIGSLGLCSGFCWSWTIVRVLRLRDQVWESASTKKGEGVRLPCQLALLDTPKVGALCIGNDLLHWMF